MKCNLKGFNALMLYCGGYIVHFVKPRPPTRLYNAIVSRG